MPFAFGFLPSPIGTAVVVRGDEGVVALRFTDSAPERALERMLAGLRGAALPDPAGFDELAHQLEEYFAGHRRTFDETLDLSGARGFTRAALEEIRRIPYAETAGYGEVAAAAGSPRAARAVGTACATTPISLLVPVHRVVRADGSPGEYGGSPEIKRHLLALEAAHGAVRA